MNHDKKTEVDVYAVELKVMRRAISLLRREN